MSASSKNILIVEDERPMAHALQLKLKYAGFAADVVFNGEEARSILTKKKFDLIILDLVMPKTDGFTLLQAIKSSKLKMKVIVMSNLSQKEDEQKAKALGAQDYFIKSNMPLTSIVEHIKKILK